MKSKKPNKPKGFKFNFYWIYAIIAVVFFGIQLMSVNTSSKEIDWIVFEDYLQNYDVDRVVIINDKNIQVYIKNEALRKEKHRGVSQKAFGSGTNKGPHYFFEMPSERFEERLKDVNSNFEKDKQISVTYKTQKDFFGDALGWILPLIIMIAIWMFFMRRMSGGGGPGGQIFNIGKSKATLFDKTKVNVSFEDVAGLEGAKEEIEEIVDFLKNPKKYTNLGGKIPRGALLVGPPGTGKTLLAKAVAGEAQVPFFSLSGSDFVEMFVGVGASRVRDLFKQEQRVFLKTKQ